MIKVVEKDFSKKVLRTPEEVESSLDKVGVRRMMIGIEKAVGEMVSEFIFEPNDDTTRQGITGMTSNYLSSIKDRNRLYDFKVVCDETNNTPVEVDNSMLVMDMYLQPAKAVEFITFRMTTRMSGTEFGDIETPTFTCETEEYLYRLGM